ncbi:MAG: TPM domain-containing protein, partial [Gammaproteobacteria bacterium]
MTSRFSLLLILLLWAGNLVAQEVEVPELTGRVVDRAELLDTQAEARLTSMLAGHEQATGEQVVVVTVPDLGGRSIEEFGLELGRTWGIGQEGEDNGALLIVARDDRKIRIEVGYGLEGRLTDAQSSVIINRIIAPAFQRGDFTAGITEGAEAIVTVLGGDPLPAELRPVMPSDWELAVTEGPHGAPDFFTDADIDLFFATDWEVHYNSSRTGVRLIGTRPQWARKDGGEAGLHPSNIHDNAYAIGAV